MAQEKLLDRFTAMRPAPLSDDSAAALNGGDDHGLARSAPPRGLVIVAIAAASLPSLAGFAANISLVGLHNPAQQAAWIIPSHH